MPDCLFISDLHGNIDNYKKLFQVVAEETPEALFMGGDLLPSVMAGLSSSASAYPSFIIDFLAENFNRLKQNLGPRYPRIFIILGNDDPRLEEAAIMEGVARGLWEYIHNCRFAFDHLDIYGYAFVPPTPFLLKDWERYDVSRYVDPGCVSPEEGWRSLPVSDNERKYTSIKKDLEQLCGKNDISRAIFLFHSPPYNTNLDWGATHGVMIDGVPLDTHLGSIAIRNFIEKRQPLITLHGHVHESTRLSGSWTDKIGRTFLFSAAHDGKELSLIRFNSEYPERANRELL